MLAGQPIERMVNGFGDARFRLSVNFYFYVASALTLREFAGYRQDLIVGGSLQATAPVRQYDSTRAVNLGTSRYFFKPELGLSQAFGRLTLDLTTEATFFTGNSNFLGGRRRAEEPIYSVQGHAIYSVRGRCHNYLGMSSG